MDEISKDHVTEETLTALFNALNSVLFGNELPFPSIAFGDLGEMLGEVDGTRTLGIFLTPADVPALERPAIFIDEPGTVEVAEGQGGNILYALADTMLHEMTHYYCFLHGIADRDKNGYHTDAFRDAAINHGMTCGWRDGGGWSITDINPYRWNGVLGALGK